MIYRLSVNTYQSVIDKLSEFHDLSVMDEKRELLLKLAQKLKELRQQKNVTQEQVLFDIGIHIARIEQGKRDISYTTLCRLADYFNVSLAEFQ